MKLFENGISNRIMLYFCATVAFFFSVFCGLLIESKTLYENVSFIQNDGMTYRLQMIETNDAIHLFCAGSEMLAEDELLFEAGKGRITFTLSDGTVYTYESGEKININILEDTVFCKIDSKYGIFAYENEFRFHEWNDLPTVSIDLTGSSLEDISEKKGLWCYATYSVSDINGMYDGNCEVRVHGNTTFSNPKKSLDMKMEEVTSFLGMDGGKRWVLISNYEDPSFMKNAVGYTLQHQLGCEYAPETQFVNVYVDGQYQGLYLLVERPDGGSVSFTIQENLQESSVSYMLELCGYLTWLESVNRFETKHRHITVRYPDIIGDQLDVLSDFVQTAESALYMENGEDDKAYHTYFDTQSFAVQYLLQEFIKNYDTELNSQYVSITDGEKIKAGPAWDFGLGLYTPYTTPFDGAELLHIKSLDDPYKASGDLWYGAMDSHEEFHELLKKIYTEEFYHKAKSIVENFGRTLMTELEDSVNMDTYLWRFDSDMDTDLTKYTADWMLSRLDFLYEYYMKEEEYCLVTFETELRYDVVLPVKRGDRLGWIPSEGRWRDKSGKLAQEETVIVGDIVFYRTEE